MLDRLSNWIVDQINKWYTRTNLTKTFKEFIFLVVMITAILIGDLYDYFNKK